MKTLLRRSLLWILISLAFIPAAAAQDLKDHSPLRILCLGDSITHSLENHCGYRYALWKKFVDLGIAVDFVGSMHARYEQQENQKCPPYKGKAFDPDHEGHWAWRADQILGEDAVRLFPHTGSGNLALWLRNYTPDIVLLHLGHNDAGGNEPPEQVAGELKEIITLLQQDNPKVAILLAKVIPAANPTWNRKLVRLNAQMDAVAAETATALSKVLVVDMTDGFNPMADTLDGTHPNDSGSEKMARIWMRGIITILRKP